MRTEYSSAAAIPAGVWQWPHIDPAREWADKMSGKIVVEPAFLDRLEQLRAIVRFPLIITSGYRTPEHNRAVSTTGEHGPHTTARAADIRVYGERALVLVQAALACGFTGIGLAQKSGTDYKGRFVHLDDLTVADGFPRPTIWTY